MHVKAILQGLFSCCRPFVDLRTLNTLFSTIESLTQCRKLTITSLGRSLIRNCTVKHKIKAVDRLFGNTKIHRVLPKFYQQILNKIIGSNPKPLITVDWSNLTPCGKYHFLRAAIPVGGRAIPVLEMTFSIKEQNSQEAHRKFLNQLKCILPKNCSPIIITDAGFKKPWFKLVENFGWDYVGRVRDNAFYKTIKGDEWQSIKHLYYKSGNLPRYLGYYCLTKRNFINTHFYAYKEKEKNRVKKNLAGKKVLCSQSLKYAKRARDPWLLATSLEPNAYRPREIVNFYKKRMQIEEGIRDLKNERIGLSLRQNRSMSIGRLNVALLIGAMTMLLLWVLGLVVKSKNLHYQYQANTIHTRNVLSIFMIGWQALEESKLKFLKNEINQAVEILRSNQYA